MLGAIFAYLAARRSGRTAADARDALAASLKPEVHLTIGQYTESGESKIEARAAVLGPLSPMGLAGVMPAADVRLEITSTKGKRGSALLPSLEPSSNGTLIANQPYLNVAVGQVTDAWPPDEGDHVTVTVTYSDRRGIGTYRKSISVDLGRSVQLGGERAVSQENLSETAETQIKP